MTVEPFAQFLIVYNHVENHYFIDLGWNMGIQYEAFRQY